jgi:N-glycosylase/DNA lyase
MSSIRKEVYQIYMMVKDKIEQRLEEFRQIWKNGSEYDIFVELSFCLLTPQSKAFTCWECIQKLDSKGMLLNADDSMLAGEIREFARFHNTKGKRIVEAREKFTENGKLTIKKELSRFDDVIKMRDWLVENIKGYGYKEASHFLRNIGFGDNIAILDRHIIKNLYLLEVIDDIPDSIKPSIYFDIEEKMRNFSKKIKIPMSHLDFVLWYKEAGEIFK